MDNSNTETIIIEQSVRKILSTIGSSPEKCSVSKPREVSSYSIRNGAYESPGTINQLRNNPPPYNLNVGFDTRFKKESSSTMEYVYQSIVDNEVNWYCFMVDSTFSDI
eukprot:TRINITY_DN1996_c0_g1_i3.p1 TRINITY_DN1996_c0_g1~~TRINITY_DN1996_c0_g1_i3.p1  ORF type:complete len:108 (-),score=23.00 TRINITY_DN1996_c0_g1_i3:38-361(-)